MKRTGLPIILVAGLLLVFGCDKKDNILPKMEIKPAPQAAGKDDGDKSSAETTQLERDNYLKTAREEINKLAANIDALTIKAQNSSSELKAKLEPQIKRFQEDLKGLEEELARLKNASAWGEVKNTLSASMKKLKDAIHNAANP